MPFCGVRAACDAYDPLILHVDGQEVESPPFPVSRGARLRSSRAMVLGDLFRRRRSVSSWKCLSASFNLCSPRLSLTRRDALPLWSLLSQRPWMVRGNCLRMPRYLLKRYLVGALPWTLRCFVPRVAPCRAVDFGVLPVLRVPVVVRFQRLSTVISAVLPATAVILLGIASASPMLL